MTASIKKGCAVVTTLTALHLNDGWKRVECVIYSFSRFGEGKSDLDNHGPSYEFLHKRTVVMLLSG